MSKAFRLIRSRFQLFPIRESSVLRSAFIIGAVIVVLVGLLLRLYFFNISTTYLPATADEILAIFIARDIAAGATPLLFWGTPYQFPTESYLMAPLVSLFPNNAFGSRVFLALLATTALIGFLKLLFEITPPSKRAAGVLLIAIPSSYLIILQAGYFIPEHTATMHFAWILPLLCYRCLCSAGTWRRIIYAGLAGLASGFALSTHLLSLPIVAAVTLAICVGSSLRSAISNTFAYLFLFVVGLLPYLATYRLAQSAAATVTANHSISEAIERFFSSLLNGTINVVLGLTAVLFPDYQTWSGYLSGMIPVLQWFFWALLMVATAKCVCQLYQRTIQDRWPRLTIWDVFVGCCWACLLAFCFSMRAKAGEFRYLLPLAWAFPFLISYLYSTERTAFRIFLFVFTVGLSALQVFHLFAIADIWKQPKFRSRFTETPDLSHVIHYLDAQGVSNCYAGFWFAYRYSYNTGGRVVCDQAYNERFLGWPLPYKKIIDKSDPVAFVLANSQFSRLQAGKFLEMLEFHRIDSTIRQIFPFFVFHDFSYKDVAHSEKIPGSETSIVSNLAPSSLHLLTDENRETVWRGVSPQVVGDWIEFRFSKPKRIHKFRSYFVEGEIEKSPSYRLEYSTNGKEFSVIRDKVQPLADRLYFDGKTHPIFFSDDRQDISFAPVVALAVRFSIVEKRSETPWQLAEVEIYHDRPSG